ncbi:DUF6882 domain-containing protein [Granulicoccus sp. GXG6511]|uniref:DUF6882 domain-containing protein n=1 Tax=Granulicoccus sp. GXG6511 TaxID=3381351 RepID=UPI003D7DCFCA
MSGLSFADVMDDSILVYVEDHERFVEWITERTGGGSDEMSVDLHKQQITYRPKLHKREEVVAPIHLLGSVATEPRSAMWAWANEHVKDLPVARMVERVRDFGASRGVAELTTPEISIPADSEGSDGLATTATTMAAISCRITGIPTAQIITGNGIRLVMLVDAAGFAPATPSGISFPRTLMSAISAPGWVHDHRRATQGYAQARNLPYGWEPNFGALNIGFPEGNVRVAFDQDGRVSDIQAAFGQQPHQPGH